MFLSSADPFLQPLDSLIALQLMIFARAVSPNPNGRKGIVLSLNIDKITHTMAAVARTILITVQMIFFVSFIFVFSFEFPVRSLWPVVEFTLRPVNGVLKDTERPNARKQWMRHTVSQKIARISEWSDPNNPGKQKPRISQTSELAVEEDLCEVFYYPINLSPKKSHRIVKQL